MAEASNQCQTVGETPVNSTTGTIKKPQRNIISRMWNGFFRRNEDFERRLQHISKEEASILAKMKSRSHNSRKKARNVIMCSVFLEVIAVAYAIMTTRSLDLKWKMRAIRVLPMFCLPAVCYVIYSTLVSYARIRDRKDQEKLERLRAERQAKIDELKERTNYYITQQLIQKYDPDPAAKAAAATVLASKLGADSGLKVYVGDESNPNETSGKSNDVEFAESTELRNRKHSHSGFTSGGTIIRHRSEEIPRAAMLDGAEAHAHNQTVVEHTPKSLAHDGGWIARFAALLVAEDPTQSYALICANCHMHNGLARKEDFLYITYYCPHCGALNKSRLSEENPSVSGSTIESAPATPNIENVSDIVSNSVTTEDKLISTIVAAVATENVEKAYDEALS